MSQKYFFVVFFVVVRNYAELALVRCTRSDIRKIKKYSNSVDIDKESIQNAKREKKEKKNQKQKLNSTTVVC